MEHVECLLRGAVPSTGNALDQVLQRLRGICDGGVTTAARPIKFSEQTHYTCTLAAPPALP